MASLAETIYTQSGRKIEFEATEKMLNLGCGGQRYPNVIGIDRAKSSAADIVHDLDVFPWPVDDSSIDVVLAFQFLEHVDDIPRLMEEVYRITKNGARIIIEVPYFRSVGAFQDPTHKHFFTTKTMDYFCANRAQNKFRYADVDFELKGFWIGWPAQSKNPLTRVFKKFIKKYHNFYDTYLSYIAPAQILVFELETKK